MALILRNILEESAQRYQLELLAGAAGLGQVMQWVYVAEDYSTANFLHGGELIITTGVISGGSAAWLLQFLHHIILQHTCGLIINEGPYLRREDISQEVLDFCDAHRFPLLLMPWRIHIYDITRDYYDRLFTDSRRDEAINRAFLSLLEPAADHSDALSVLPDYRFPPEAPYYVAAFDLPGQRELVLSDNGHLTTQIFAALSELRWPCYLVNRNGVLFLVCQQAERREVETVVQSLQALIRDSYPALPFFAGIGGQVEGLDGLSRSCQQARSALQMGLHRQEPLFRYEDMGFFKLLLEVSDRSVLQAYVDSHLGPVHAYDVKHGSRFSETLYLYLLHDRSLQAVAEATYCHRNTIRHRLLLMKETMGYRLEDPMVRLELMTAFLTEQYLNIWMPL